MKRALHVAVVGGSLAYLACADQPTAAYEAPPPAFDLAASSGAGTGTYILAYDGDAMAQDAAAYLAASGGTIVRAWPEIRYSVVEGIDAEGASYMESFVSVTRVSEDATLS